MLRYDSHFDAETTRINGRHAFVYERVLALVVRETQLRESVTFSKQDLARRMGCCARSVDRAVQKLRRDGLIESEAVYNENGAQLGNMYRATQEGIDLVATFRREKKPARGAAAIGATKADAS